MNLKITSILSAFVLAFFFSGCQSKGEKNMPKENVLTEMQTSLIEKGWELRKDGITNGEFPSEYGVTPCYGIQDNYFDIQMGHGGNIAMKIIDLSTDRCIRYVYVNENSTTTINQIPQGQYYVKIAFGYDWMELRSTDSIVGKFSSNCMYEKSLTIFDFGKKNSQGMVDYTLKINVEDGMLSNNFNTTEISEDEFLSNN